MAFLQGAEPDPGWSSYAACTGSAYSHFANINDPEYHNGAIVDAYRAKVKLVSIAKLDALDGTSRTFLAGDMDYGLSNIAAMSGGVPKREAARPGEAATPSRAKVPSPAASTPTASSRFRSNGIPSAAIIRAA